MKVRVELKSGRKLVFEDIDNYTVNTGILRLRQGENNTILFNWDEVICVGMPEELNMSEYKSTLGGRWIETEDTMEEYGTLFKCSECGNLTLEADNYCTHCGARMEDEYEPTK